MDAARKNCFIAMPVATTAAQAEFYGDKEHWMHVMETLFVPAVEQAGFGVWRPVARGSHLIHAEIVRQLEQADMVLCDISGSNPNVFFELGVRTSVNKPIALVRCDSSTPIPFDVSGINTHTYDPSLKAWNNESETQALVRHLADAEVSCAGENPLWKQFGMVLKAKEPTTGGTREEAMLSVLTQKMNQLTAQVNSAIQEKTMRTEGFSNAPLAIPTMTRNDILQLISEMAKEYNQMINMEISSADGLVIGQSGPATDEGHEFRQRVRRQMDSIGLDVKFYSALRVEESE